MPRIVGLEPAKFSLKNLEPADASFVMTIHTSNLVSLKSVVGHAGFYLNGGVNQPQCKITSLLNWFIPYDPYCNHGAVQAYWTEAVKSQSSTIFPARKCNNVDEFESKSCDPSAPIGYMNLQTSSLLRGKYYLSTNAQSPYSFATADP